MADGDQLEPIIEPDPPSVDRGRSNRLAVVAGAALLVGVGVLAWSTLRLAAQGERDECLRRAEVRAGLQQFGEPDGVSSERLDLERRARCLGLSLKPEPVTPSSIVAFRRCPSSLGLFGGRGAPPSADGLPPSGQATRQRAESALRRRSPRIPARILAIDDYAWQRDDSGEVEIVPEQLFVLEVEVKNEEDCPSSPATDGGVPLLFVYPES